MNNDILLSKFCKIHSFFNKFNKLTKKIVTFSLRHLLIKMMSVYIMSIYSVNVDIKVKKISLETFYYISH